MWKDDIDNSTNPFVPKIKVKPNAITPLDKSIEQGILPEQATLPGQVRGFPHPYQYELAHLGYEAWMLNSRTEQIYASLEDTPITFVNTEEELVKLANKLQEVREIAIDLEAHQYRSFQGFTCLMQLSTRSEDYIIDTLALRKSMHILNTSFTNPKIVKVIHGSDFDILWLQRDFGLYVVNLFDTGQASRVLEYPSYALSYLLKFYCGITADKQYQKADWRIRPLPLPMFKYAREDTHYLLYIYDRMRNDAISRVNGSTELVQAILNRSRDLSLQRYEKELNTPNSFLELINKFRADLDPQQTEVFAAVYNWRDKICRLEDESTRYVLPNHMILQIADRLPDDDKALQAACVPVPPLVKMNLPELLDIIRKAKARGAQAALQQAASKANAAQRAALPDRQIDVTSSDDLIRQAGWYSDSTSSLGLAWPSTSVDMTSSGNISGSGLFGSPFLDEEAGGSILDSGSGSYSESKSIADNIRSSFNLTSWIPSSAQILDRVDAEEEEAAAEEGEEESQPSKTEQPGDLFGGIPQSMKEIYRLSNQTKRNKKKRDAETDPQQAVLGSPQSPFYLQDGDMQTDIRAAKRAKITDTEADRAQFAAEVGWVADTPSKFPQSSSSTGSKTSGKAPSATDKPQYAVYDYTKHKEARPAPGPAQQAATRGYSSESALNPFPVNANAKKDKGGKPHEQRNKRNDDRPIQKGGGRGGKGHA